MSMWNWLALLGTPTISLTVLCVGFALVTPSCAHQSMAWLHAIHVAGIALGVGLTLAAWMQKAVPAGEIATARHGFVQRMAVPTGSLFTLVMLAQWVATWVLSPCDA